MAEEFVVQLIAEGRISIGKAVELLKTTHYDLYRIAQKQGVKLSATPEQGKKSRETLKNFFSRYYPDKMKNGVKNY